jgi:hypothetical protein
MDDPAPHQPPYGFLLILRLLRRAAYDKRVTGFQHRVLSYCQKLVTVGSGGAFD